VFVQFIEKFWQQLFDNGNVIGNIDFSMRYFMFFIIQIFSIGLLFVC